jgi:hypothetical protein
VSGEQLRGACGARGLQYEMPRLALLSLCCLVLGSSSLRAQIPPVATDATVGIGNGRGGPPFTNRVGLAGYTLVAIARGSDRARGRIWAASAGWQGPGPVGGDKCILEPNGGCRPEFWAFTSYAVLAGWQQENGGFGTREFVGPALFQTEGSRTAGLDARVDIASPRLVHLRFVLAAKASVLPRFRGHTYLLTATTIGIRMQ